MQCDQAKVPPPNSVLGRVLRLTASTATPGRVVRLPFKLIPKGTVLSVLAGLTRGMKWVVGSSVHECWLGSYELDKQAVTERFVKPGMTVFDIGANAGFYTLSFSRLVGDRGQVWAFEPFAENVSNIMRHIELNRLRNVTLLQAAVADQTGIVGFRRAEHNAMGAIAEHGQFKVPTVSLDDLIAAYVIPVPDVIKLDVEGAESLVLEGAKSLLSEKRTTLFIALHGEEQKNRCREMLESAGYSIFLLDGTALGDGALQSAEIYAVPHGS